MEGGRDERLPHLRTADVHLRTLLPVRVHDAAKGVGTVSGVRGLEGAHDLSPREAAVGMFGVHPGPGSGAVCAGAAESGEALGQQVEVARQVWTGMAGRGGVGRGRAWQAGRGLDRRGKQRHG